VSGSAGEDPAAALRAVALEKAIDYHAKNAQHPSSKGPAGPTTVMATAEQFVTFLQQAAREAGVTAADVAPGHSTAAAPETGDRRR
jgi:hypothetical protein